MASSQHRPLYIVALIVMVVFYACVLFINAMSATSLGKELGIFLNSTGGISDKYTTEITPIGWTFSIWGVIYTWQCLWIGYTFSLFCRQGVDGYLYYSPAFMPPAIYVIYAINCGLNIGWLLLWDREIMIVALVFLIGIFSTLYACIGLSFRSLNTNYNTLVGFDLTKEIWFVRLFVQNGLGVYATWTTIATLLNLSIVLTYWAYLTPLVTSMIALSILSVVLIVWFALDMSILDKHSRYLFTPYCVVVWALSGVLSKQWSPEKASAIYTATLLAVAGVFLIVKSIVMIVRHKKGHTIQVSFVMDEKTPTMNSPDKTP